MVSFLLFLCHDEVLQHRPAPESGLAGVPLSLQVHNAVWQGFSSRYRWPSHAVQRWLGCRTFCPSSGSRRLQGWQSNEISCTFINSPQTVRSEIIRCYFMFIGRRAQVHLSITHYLFFTPNYKQKET